MKFGLWVEPEMVNPDSDLYRQHPDWAMHFPGRPRTEGRNQLVLNMARDDVKEHIFGVLDALLTNNHIAFLKWDMNRNFSEPGWPEAPAGAQKEIWVKYVNNVYAIIDRLRERHPGLEIESCSGGGGRVDLGMLSRVDQVWTSDNTEAFDRLRIQDGFSAAYAPKVMMAWVTDVPNMNGRSTPLKFRFLVAMMGSLGIGANLNHWSDADFALARQHDRPCIKRSAKRCSRAASTGWRRRAKARSRRMNTCPTMAARPCCSLFSRTSNCSDTCRRSACEVSMRRPFIGYEPSIISWPTAARPSAALRS